MVLYVLGTIRSGLTAAVGTQIILTMASLGYASGRLGGTPSPLLNKPIKETFDARHYDYVTEFVTCLYTGRGVSQQLHVKLLDTITFEDPAAQCHGADEVREAFRALTKLQPRSLSPPRCVHVQPLGEAIAISYALHQEYMNGRVVLPSLLIVTVQLRQRKDVPESEFVVMKLQEQWNGIPYWDSYLFWIVRRINGIVSYQLTRRLL